MNDWIGPAVIAALISSLVSVGGWYAGYRVSLGLERHRRLEKIRDFQIALRAEIRSELHDLQAHDTPEILASIEAKYRQVDSFSVRVPSPARHAVFEAIVNELHLLPEEVIDPVVIYYRQRDTIERFVADLRAPDFPALACRTAARDVQGLHRNAPLPAGACANSCRGPR
ncbi:hypothetical protein [Mangrovicella endophytica]|uniref:hypothetical protein n=1 Tax=Mangrovicella endophytica TaxID=2066697 RepID=UPI000C9E3DE6|nr:hypothetical protein [Mangrovicella endophytica]